MQNYILLNLSGLTINDITGHYLTRTVLLGLTTFVFFFFLLKAFDKHNISKVLMKSIREKWDLIRHGNSIMLVKDGVLQLDKLYVADITAQQVYAAIRRKNINNLADVERLFLIPGGEFSIYKKQNTDGLPLLHYSEKEMLDAQ